MSIRKVKETSSGDDIIINMDGGVGGSWTVIQDSNDDQNDPYVGVPAPVYLEKDPWFSDPVLSEKQLSYKEAHEKAVKENLILDESKESDDIHQKLYEVATKNWTTVSENFQEVTGSWDSGIGFQCE